MTKVTKVAKTTQTKTVPTREELMAKMLESLSEDQKSAMFPPIERKNFVVRKSWLGRNQVITFTNNKGITLKYNHDTVLTMMLPRLEISPCWLKRGYWSQSTDLPSYVRHLAEVVE
jgi:hypothetical protein